MQYLKFYKSFGTTIVKDKLYPIVDRYIDGDDELLYFLPQDEVKTIVHKSREGELFEIIEELTVEEVAKALIKSSQTASSY